VEEMIKSGIALGLSTEQATTLAIQTIVGSAAMLEQSGKSATTLRENVTSPNGTTAAALNVFSESKLGEIIEKAMTAARDRSQELA
jgi:pyrroline-5-carboxylate reductase